MVVKRDELEELQGFIQKQLVELEKQGDSSGHIFSLTSIDSNIELLLSSVDSQTVELGSRDEAVKDFLLEYKGSIAQKKTEEAYLGEISYYASEASAALLKIREVLPSSEPLFSSNLNSVLNQINNAIKELVSLESSPRMVQKLKTVDFSQEKSGVKTTAAKTATKTTAKPKTAVKSAEEKTVSHRGRPKKVES